MNRFSKIIRISSIIAISVLFGFTIASSFPMDVKEKSIPTYPVSINIVSLGY